MAGLTRRDANVLARFEGFCAQEGLGSPGVALGREAIIEAFLAIDCPGLAPHSLGTYRSVLRRLGGGPFGAQRGFAGSPAPRPYSKREVAALWSMAQHQPSRLRICNATVLLASMVGAGLHPGELAELKANDVTRTFDQVEVIVGGARGRRVRVHSPYGAELFDLALGQAGYLFRPGAGVRSAKNLVGEVCAALVRDPDEVPLLSGRARSTFICLHLGEGTPLDQITEAAGLQSVESLLRYARHVKGAPRSKAHLRAAARAPTS